MARSKKSQNKPLPTVNQAPSTIPGVMRVSQQMTQTFEGPIPPPSVLSQYDAIVPGAADRILAMAESETHHRHAQEVAAMNANISLQNRQIALAEEQHKAVFRSDLIGQILGFVASALALCGAIFLGKIGATVVASALAALPIAGIIRAFRESVKKK